MALIFVNEMKLFGIGHFEYARKRVVLPGFELG